MQGCFGIHVTKSLSAAGFRAPDAESSQVADMMSNKFGQGDLQMVFAVTDGHGRGPRRRRPRRRHRPGRLGCETLPYVADVTSAWTAPPPQASGLISGDGKTGLVVVGINGDGSETQRYAKELAARFAGPRGGLTVQAGGPAMAYVELNAQSERDLLAMEALAIPFSFLVLVGVFGGLLAAAVPLAVGIWAIVGSMAMLRVLTLCTEVSTFALNLTIAMGLALAVDYTLLILSRYREERAAGVDMDAALLVTMSTAGRTVVFSATTVGLSMVALAIFPMYFLRSFAFAGITVVALTALGALVLAPAAIVLLGDRLDALDLRRLIRRLRHRRRPNTDSGIAQRDSRSGARSWSPSRAPSCCCVSGRRSRTCAGASPMSGCCPSRRRPARSATGCAPTSRYDPGTAMTIVVPEASGIDDRELARFARDLSLTEYVDAVSAPTGTYVDGVAEGPPSAPTAVENGSPFLTVKSTPPPSAAADRPEPTRLDPHDHRARRQSVPRRWQSAGHRGQRRGDQRAAATGAAGDGGHLVRAALPAHRKRRVAAEGDPAQRAVADRNVRCAGVDLPGRRAWRSRHDGDGSLVAQVPVLLFCVAFGLSMDYEVFLISRIREYWLASPAGHARRQRRGHRDGVGPHRAHRHRRRPVDGDLVLGADGLAGLPDGMFGLGLTLAVLMDATLVRMLMVPAFMHLLGRRNWWAPARMARFHQRFGIHEVAPARRIARTGGRHRARPFERGLPSRS